MSAKPAQFPIAFILVCMALPVYAQSVPLWVVVGALSPIVVMLMCFTLGLLTRSLRTGALHAAIVLVWIVLFFLASYYVENDYVIWTPLVLYLVHAVLLLILIAVEDFRRMIRKRRTA